jgi:hypothetical protein
MGALSLAPLFTGPLRHASLTIKEVQNTRTNPIILVGLIYPTKKVMSRHNHSA